MSTTPPPTNVIPILAGPAVIKRRPGRPKEVRPQPVVAHDEAQYVQRLSELTRHGIDTDPVVQAMEQPMGTVARLDVIIRSLAEESAGLLFEREKLTAEARSDGVPQLCGCRIECLQRLSRIVIEREVLKRQAGEMSDVTVAKLVGMLVDKSLEVVREVAPAQAAAFTALLNEQVAGASWSMSG